MRLANIAHLYVVRLKARVVLVQELFAVLGIAVGVALLFASQIASTSLNGSVAQLVSGVVGQSTYQLKARGPGGFDEALLGQVQRLPGVRSAVPVLDVDAYVVGPRGGESVDLVATDPRYVHLAGSLLSHLAGGVQVAHARVLALPSPVASHIGVGPLETVRLQVGGHVVRALFGLELTAHSIGGLVDSPIALAPLTYAQRAAEMPGRITRVLVRARPGEAGQVHAELVRLAAGRLNVEPANYEAALFNQAATPVNQSTQTFAAICALLGFMFAFCAMLLTTDLRRGLVRELRRSGATRGEAVKTLLFDALVLAAVAAVLGLALGDLLSIVAFSSPPGFLSLAFPIGSQRIITWQSVGIAVGAGAAAACVGVLIPMRDIWERPGRASERREHRFSMRLMAGMCAGGCACLAATAIILIAAPQSAIVGVVLLIGALLLLLAPALEAVVAVFARLQSPRGSGATALAIVELRSPQTRGRSIAIAATAAVAVFGSVTIQGSRASLQSGLDRSFHEIDSVADLWVTPSGERGLFTTVSFADALSAKLARLPGVRAVGSYRGGFLEYAGRQVWVLAPPSSLRQPLPSSQIVGGNLALANARLRAGGWAVISKTLAADQHLHVGQSFTLPAPKSMTFRVAALLTNLGWPPGAVMLNSKDYARAWESGDLSAYNLVLGAGVSVAAAQRAVRGVLGPGSGLEVQTATQREQSQQATSRQGLDRLTQIAVIVLMAGVLATATVMAGMIWQRRRRFARMKVQGYGHHTLWTSLIWESGLLIGVGCLVGAVFGVCGQLLLSHALVAVTGFPLILSVNSMVAFASFLVVTVAAAVCVAIPGYRAAAIEPYPWPSV
jgi:putative ABC transport system permease protein